jgi:hypothetical protein
MSITTLPADPIERADVQWIVQALESGDRGAAVERLLRKCLRQREALDLLHTRVVNQRFQLRTLNELGRGLSKDEFLAVRAQVGNEAVRERIGEQPAA